MTGAVSFRRMLGGTPQPSPASVHQAVAKAAVDGGRREASDQLIRFSQCPRETPQLAPIVGIAELDIDSIPLNRADDGELHWHVHPHGRSGPGYGRIPLMED